MKLFVETAARAIPLSGPVLEIGAARIAEGVEGDLRPLLPKAYLGLDMREEQGVNVIGNAERLPLAEGGLGTIVTVATMEHISDPIRTAQEMHRVLRPSGILIMTPIFCFPIHAYPSDYWRFTPECFNLLLSRFGCRIVSALGSPSLPIWVMGIGFKTNGSADASNWETRASRLHQEYLQALRGIAVTSSTSRIVDLVRALPVIGRRRPPSLAEMGLAVRRGMGLSTSVYSTDALLHEIHDNVE
jgi:SAM-dependent methyltransferase